MLQGQIGQLYRRIDSLNADKIAIAFSGGGDSTALLHALRGVPNVTHALIIDHNLRTESAKEVEGARQFAESLGYKVRTQIWQHGSPDKGIQVKARTFRYAAMGQMCREEGITHLLTAHTEDDQAETLLMRRDRDTGWRGLAGMRQTAYGALWPALADVTLVRPLLNVSRNALRDYNRRQGLDWIEDPSNENQDFTRVRARQKLSDSSDLKAQLLNQQSEAKHRLQAERQQFKAWMAQNARLDAQGFFELNEVPPAELLLQLLCLASGSGGPIDSARRLALAESMKSPDFKAATLGGAWILKANDGFLITRDKVAVSGRKDSAEKQMPAIVLEKGRTIVWDGRFLIEAKTENMRVFPAFGYLQKLREDIEIKNLFYLPKSVRPTLPVFIQNNDFIGFGQVDRSGIQSDCLVAKRLEALWSVN